MYGSLWGLSCPVFCVIGACAVVLTRTVHGTCPTGRCWGTTLPLLLVLALVVVLVQMQVSEWVPVLVPAGMLVVGTKGSWSVTPPPPPSP